MIEGDFEECENFEGKEEGARSMYHRLRVEMRFGIEYIERNIVSHKRHATLPWPYFN